MESHDIEKLYRRLGPLIYRRCLRLLGNSENARDATQEVFVRALRHAPELVWDRECLPWLYRVATNHCLNRIRNGRSLEFREIEMIPQLVEERPPAVDERLAARGKVLALLSMVDEETGQIAVFAHVDGMTQDEIAEVMGLSRKTVGKKLARFNSLARSEQEQTP